MYPIYTYLYVRSLAFAFEVLKAIGMRRKRVVSAAAAAAAAGLGLSLASSHGTRFLLLEITFLPRKLLLADRVDPPKNDTGG